MRSFMISTYIKSYYRAGKGFPSEEKSANVKGVPKRLLTEPTSPCGPAIAVPKLSMSFPAKTIAGQGAFANAGDSLRPH
ncbi:MAG: hypothetical protein AUK25_01795 [Desulfobacteraceae bacterium CG2_30_51_40]|nr:MAG: hypothetical protein AUK25_01795 [Desulfobacteraceae bacterium CG2_30_51_40]